LQEDHHHHSIENFADWVKQHPKDTYEGPLKTRTGTIRTILWSNSAILSKNSDELTAIAIGQDITKRKQAEEALRKSERRYELATAAARVGVWEWDLKTGEFYLDPNIKAILGYQDNEIPNDLNIWSGYVHPDDRQQVMEAAQAHLEGRTPEYVFEHRMLHKDGSIRWIFVRGKAIRDANGTVLRMVGTDTDITEGKIVENTLRESEKRFRELTDLLPQTVYEMNMEGNITFSNRQGFELTGYTQDDIDKGLNIHQLFIPEDRDRLKTDIQKRLKGEELGNHEYTLLRRDGLTLPILAYSDQANEEMICAILDATTETILLLDNQMNILAANDTASQRLGISLDDLIGFNYGNMPSDIVPDEVLKFRLERIQKVIDSGESIRFEDGRKGVLYDNNIYPIFNSQGEVIRVAIFARDITERKRAEAALRDSEIRYRTLFENAVDAIFLENENEEIIDVNRQACRLVGYSRDELIMMKTTDLETPEISALPKLPIYTNANTNIDTPVEKIVKHRNGRLIPTEFTITSFKAGEQTLFLSILREISDRKKAEKSLRESEEKWRSLVENAPDNILTVERGGTVSFINRAYQGRMPKDVIGQSIYSFVPPEYHDNVHNSIDKVFQTGEPDSYEVKSQDTFGAKWYLNQIGPIKHDGKVNSVIIISTDITARKQTEAREKARFRLLKKLRTTEDIDQCLTLGCKAIYDAELFKRAVLTLHNEKKEITNMGYIGLDEQVVLAARNAPAADDALLKKMTQEKYRISNSYFIPEEATIPLSEMPRRILQKESAKKIISAWRSGDELFVPIFGENRKYRGWLSVDTPLSGKRPTLEIVKMLEEIVEIATQQIREIKILEKLNRGHKELQEKNVALREILGHIEEEKRVIKKQVAENIDQVLLPALKKVGKPDGSVNPFYLELIDSGLKDLAETSGGLLRIYSSLSPREVEVCNMIKQGATTKEISTELYITVGTVKRHRETIRKKLGIKNKEINLSTFLKNL
jgi:PAS domain S-box-containing protein